MLVSKKLLAKFIPKIDQIDDQQFIDACGAIGIEVESIIKHPSINNLVIGQITKINQHPNADKLHVCEVRIDNTDNVNTIVCGASNVAINRKVIVALSGAKLHDGRIIEYKELRGILSQGMLCSYSELTPHHNFLANDDEKGIILLDDATVGDKNISKYIGLDDETYDLSLPSNRNDLNGVLSLCQDLSGYFKWDFTFPKIGECKGLYDEKIELFYDRSLANGLCALKIKNINKNTSSWLFKSLLMNNGIKPINQTIDNLNYVTLLTNIPLAVYDAVLIHNSLKIDRAQTNEKILGFDHKEYSLTTNDIVIRSNDKLIGLGGILGDEHYGISKQTNDVIIEIANFNYINIHNTAKRLDIKTDAAKRCGKPISTYLNLLTLNLIYQQFNHQQISNPSINIQDPTRIEIQLDTNQISQYIGIKLQNEVIKSNLQYYGYSFNENNCIAPLHRLDILTNQDLSEEVVKFLDINELSPEPIIGIIDNTQANTEYHLSQKIKSLMINNYFNEVKTYNLTSKEKLNEFNIFSHNEYVKIDNVHNQSRAYLRTNLIHAMLNIYQLNNSYKTKLEPIFEYQKIYTKKNTYQNLTLLSPKTIHIDRINNSYIEMNVNVFKSLANEIAKIFNVTFNFLITSDKHIFYDNELLAIQCAGQLIGYIGSIKQSKLQEFDIQNESIYCMSINLDLLFQLYHKLVMHYQSVNNLMPIYKDISFIIHRNEKIGNLLNTLKKLNFIDNYEFIDRYKINDNEISYTLRFRFNNARGLDSKVIDNYLLEIEKIMVENHTNIRK